MKRRILMLIVAVAVIAAAVYFYRRSKRTEPANQITLSGNIEAHESLVGFKVQGRIAELPVEEGQQIERGALLARLDDADYTQKLRIDQATVGVRESNLALVLAGTREQEIKAAQQNMVDAEAEARQRQLDYNRAEQLFRRDAVSAQDRDQAETALKRAQANFEAAKQRYNQSVEGSRKEDIAVARANVQQARANLGLSKVNLDYTSLRAPSAGVITVRQAELGEVVVPGTPIVTLADLDHIWLRAYIAETDLGRIRWGQDATITTDTSCGAVIAMHDSFTPLGGLVPLVNMQLGEVVFGGVGTGLYGMLVFAVLTVFIAGLMIGRTPEYLGKKIETFDMKMVSIAILATPILVLVGTAIAVGADAGKAGIANPGAHGFSEVLYAFSSAANNNGSAFAGLSANTPFYNTMLAVAMWFGRFAVIVPVLALAGSLAAKKRLPVTAGTLPTHGPIFVLLLIGSVVLVGLLNYVPALALGPIAEHLSLFSAK